MTTNMLVLWLSLGWHAPFSGLASVISVAFVGAVSLLAVANLIRHATMRTHRV